MKLKIIYISFVIFAAVLSLISIFTSRELKDSQQALKENEAPVVAAQQQFSPVASQPQAVSFKAPSGITITKPANHEKTPPPEVKEEEIAAVEEVSQVKNYATSSATEQNVDNAEAGELISGIERIN